MYYFQEIKTLKIVSRQFKFNLEVLDGKLIEIEPTTKCLLLAHVPNKKWSYDVTIIEKLDAQDGINRLNPLPQKNTEPKEFYAVILEIDYDTYVQDYGFREVKGKPKKPKKDDIIKNKIKPKIIKINSKDNNIDLEIVSKVNSGEEYSPSLVRTSEKTVYKFRSGSQRY